MIRLLKSNNPTNFILMFVLMALLWTFKFIYMPTPIESYGYYTYIIPEPGELMLWKYLSAISAFLLYYGFAFFLIKINSDLSIIEYGYQTPGLFYVILTGLYINVQRILPEAVSSMLLFIAIERIFYSYKKFKAYGNCFDAGLLSGLMILLTYKFVLFLPMLIITLITIRPFKWREFISFILGLLCPLVIAVSLIYLYADPNEFIGTIKQSFAETSIRFNKYNIYIFLPVIILTAISIISKFVLNVPQNILTRKSQNILILLLLFTLVYFLSPVSNNESVVLFFAPLSLLMANIFVNTNKITGMLLFWGSLLCIIFLQIIQIKLIY